MTTFKILLCGISGGRLEPELRQRIESCGAVAAAQRHHELLAARLDIRRIAITPVEEMIFETAVALQNSDVAVLASGDPLFFGIGRTLLERFGPERVEIFPAISAVQLACARFKLPWDDLVLISLHGRSPGLLAGKILARPNTLLFTDPRRSPDRIATELLALLKEHGDTARLQRLHVRVAENLGLPEERLWQGSLEETAQAKFADLNLMLIEQSSTGSADSTGAACVFGLQEDEIKHSRGLITKDEVRAVILHRLRLPASGVFWDVGGGSGSVSVEAARLCPELAVYIVEQKEEGWRNIRANIARYGLYNITLVRGQAPEALRSLPDPDRIFIGGSRGLLAEIIAPCAQRLAKGGRLVVSAVLQNTAEQAPLLMTANGLEADSRTISVTREQKDFDEDGQPSGLRLNPITIITGKK
ncbi:MAG: precorrin-6y C5,15-methyltransferase (decarboxylating) subunit CbiE [Candidatus Electronema sp. V4]|uniref:precorrin-6y C5,15-methyltransferase (decarboxylating) subunit CbiE n=1 Tax=Candidatus Electronema sp. V4 TaxID=3454756 RepID=UPI00405550B4